MTLTAIDPGLPGDFILLLAVVFSVLMVVCFTFAYLSEVRDSGALGVVAAVAFCLAFLVFASVVPTTQMEYHTRLNAVKQEALADLGYTVLESSGNNEWYVRDESGEIRLIYIIHLGGNEYQTTEIQR